MNLPTQLQQTLPHLIERWAPFNQEIVASLLKRESTTTPHRDSEEEVLRELRQDPSLLCWCLIKNGSQDDTSTQSAAAAIKQRLSHGVKRLSRKKTGAGEIHSLNQASPLQKQLLFRSLKRTSASSAIAPYFDTDEELACAVTALAELGTSLIAWNYPHIYRKTVERADRANLPGEKYQKQIDIWLATTLGFTPYLISQAIAQQNDLPVEVKIGLGQAEERSSLSPESALAGSTLKKISTICDSYARGTEPGAGAYSLALWESRRKELERVVGEHGIALMENAAESVLRRYSKIVPEINPEETRQPRGIKAPSLLFQKNLHIAHCSNELQQALRSLYQEIESGHPRGEIVSALLAAATETAGFYSGAIYIADDSSVTLSPLYIAGDLTAAWPTLTIESEENRDNPIVLSFLSKSPVTETPRRDQLTSFSGILRGAQRSGVLYLELNQQDTANSRIRPRSHFKALQQAVTDSLHLL